MKLRAAIILAVSLMMSAGAAIAAEQQAPAVPTAPVQTAKLAEPNAADRISEESYLLTWQKDPRYRARDPFHTVLHSMDGAAGEMIEKLKAPQTPGEEKAFVAKAEACVQEAILALDEADYKAAKDRLALLDKMVAVPLVTQSAKDKMSEVAVAAAEAQKRYGTMRARAALTEALQIAARMQAYFESQRYSEVISADVELRELDTEEGLRSPEVAATAAQVLEKTAELRRRAEIHIEFAQQDLLIDAVSFFPEGRSYAIINGEVYGEGISLSKNLTVAEVASSEVLFEYKGERISLELAE